VIAETQFELARWRRRALIFLNRDVRRHLPLSVLSRMRKELIVTQTKREIRYEIRIGAEVKERLKRLAKVMQVPSATLGAFAVESWVAQQERTLASIEAFGERVGGEIGVRLKGMMHTGMFARQGNMPDRLELTEREIGAIAEHEQLSENSAAGLGSALVQSNEGIGEIARFIRENSENARLNGNVGKAQDLGEILAQFREPRLS
jgi:predicted DNA-binding protein